jgi:N-acetylneuraminate synthase
MNSKVFIIAEAGVNHNGSLDLAFKLIDAAASAGVDAIKFQTFKAENLVTRGANKAEYQIQATGLDESQYKMLKNLELKYDMHHELMSYCIEKKIRFLSTAFDSESLYFLVNKLNLKTLKISSGEITNAPLLLEYAKTGCNLILSTGMSTLDEISMALGVIAFGLLNREDLVVTPSRESFMQAFSSALGQKILKEKVVLLHCTTEYPAPANEINLNAMVTMRNTFGLSTGYSDHSDGVVVPIIATAMGATMIEKHFTLDKNLPGPDHKASLDPNELTNMVDQIRFAEQVMGSDIKEPTYSELKNREIVRKSLVATSMINIGDKFTVNNIGIKRPGSGTDPINYWDIIDTISSKDYKVDDFI